MKALLLILNIFFAYFTDKAGSTTIALSEQAIERRNAQNIAIDSLDYAVSPLYIDSLQKLGAEILYTSRWINGVTMRMSEETAEEVRKLGFVDSLEVTKNEHPVSASLVRKKMPQIHNGYNRSDLQNNMIGVDKMHQAGFEGQGKTIAVIDDGFCNVNTNTAFAESRSHIRDTFNLVPSMGGIYTSGSHGAMCLSLIAAKQANEFIGVAPQADFYLIRSEDTASETMLEVDNQVRGFEIADSVGADIITSSLGYKWFDDGLNNDITYEKHDGKTARNSIAATIAARKGMIVCISAGNDGMRANDYHITSPADADSILAVGAVQEKMDYAYFSSQGPTADERIKPDICAMGQGICVINTDGTCHIGDGTSFATPLIAGMAAALWQALPQLNNMEIIERIKEFASQHANPDNYLGYGVANFWNSYNGTKDAIEKNETTERTIRKVLQNGQFIIIKDNQVFDILGRRL